MSMINCYQTPDLRGTGLPSQANQGRVYRNFMGGAKPPPRKIPSIIEIYLPPPNFNVFTRI